MSNQSLPDVVDKASGCKQVSHVFFEKFKTIYTSVPTPDIDMVHTWHIHGTYMAHTCMTNIISNRISNTNCNINVTPYVINDCIAKLKRDKSDGNVGLKSNHLVHGGRHIPVLLSLLFDAMIVHGHYPSELLKSTIVSIQGLRIRQLHCLIVIIIEAFLCSTVFTNYLIMLLLIYVGIICQQVICSMVIRIIIQLLCVL